MALSKAALGKRLAQLRAQAGLSQRECARALDVTDKAVSKWETGSSFPSMESMVSIARLYGIELSELFAGAEGSTGRITLLAVTGTASLEKATAMHRVEAQLDMKGYRVVSLGNTAEQLFCEGASPQLCGTESFCVQATLLQLAREEEALRAARAMRTEKVAVLCDGGLMDARERATSMDYAVALRAAGITDEQALARYDAVFRWPSAEHPAPKSKTGEPYGTVTQPPDEFLRPDDGPHARDAENHMDAPKPDDAAARLVADVLARLNEGTPYGEERVLLIRKPANTVFGTLKDARRETVATSFITGPDGVTHELTERSEGDGKTRYLDAQPIGAAECSHAIAFADPSCARLEKERWSFREGPLFIQVDRYPFMPYTALARVRTCAPDRPFSVPGFLKVVREVTGSSRFSELTLARELKAGRL